MKQKQVVGLDCVELANEAVSLLVPTGVGPRVLSLEAFGGANMLAELPAFELDCPGAGKLPLWGGHRLWHGPELPARTYLPDNKPVDIVQTDKRISVTQAADASNLEKTLHISLPDERATVIIEHALTNRGLWPIECAPWAITQLRAGGMAILPQNTAFVDEGGFMANRPISLWPYADINSQHVTWGNRYIFYQANMRGDTAFKVGFPNPVGWLAYWLDGQLFIKSAEYDPTATYYDNQSSSECYCNAHFLELETLGPRTVIDPGATITHREMWRVLNNVPPIPDEDAAADFFASIDL